LRVLLALQEDCGIDVDDETLNDLVNGDQITCGVFAATVVQRNIGTEFNDLAVLQKSVEKSFLDEIGTHYIDRNTPYRR